VAGDFGHRKGETGGVPRADEGEYDGDKIRKRTID
jgi:hypothetical protein